MGRSAAAANVGRSPAAGGGGGLASRAQSLAVFAGAQCERPRVVGGPHVSVGTKFLWRTLSSVRHRIMLFLWRTV